MFEQHQQQPSGGNAVVAPPPPLGLEEHELALIREAVVATATSSLASRKSRSNNSVGGLSKSMSDLNFTYSDTEEHDDDDSANNSSNNIIATDFCAMSIDDTVMTTNTPASGRSLRLSRAAGAGGLGCGSSVGNISLGGWRSMSSLSFVVDPSSCDNESLAFDNDANNDDGGNACWWNDDDEDVVVGQKTGCEAAAMTASASAAPVTPRGNNSRTFQIRVEAEGQRQLGSSSSSGLSILRTPTLSTSNNNTNTRPKLDLGNRSMSFKKCKLSPTTVMTPTTPKKSNHNSGVLRTVGAMSPLAFSPKSPPLLSVETDPGSSTPKIKMGNKNQLSSQTPATIAPTPVTPTSKLIKIKAGHLQKNNSTKQILAALRQWHKEQQPQSPEKASTTSTTSMSRSTIDATADLVPSSIYRQQQQQPAPEKLKTTKKKKKKKVDGTSSGTSKKVIRRMHSSEANLDLGDDELENLLKLAAAAAASQATAENNNNRFNDCTTATANPDTPQYPQSVSERTASTAECSSSSSNGSRYEHDYFSSERQSSKSSHAVVDDPEAVAAAAAAAAEHDTGRATARRKSRSSSGSRSRSKSRGRSTRSSEEPGSRRDDRESGRSKSRAKRRSSSTRPPTSRGNDDVRAGEDTCGKVARTRSKSRSSSTRRDAVRVSADVEPKKERARSKSRSRSSTTRPLPPDDANARRTRSKSRSRSRSDVREDSAVVRRSKSRGRHTVEAAKDERSTSRRSRSCARDAEKSDQRSMLSSSKKPSSSPTTDDDRRRRGRSCSRSDGLLQRERSRRNISSSDEEKCRNVLRAPSMIDLRSPPSPHSENGQLGIQSSGRIVVHQQQLNSDKPRTRSNAPNKKIDSSMMRSLKVPKTGASSYQEMDSATTVASEVMIWDVDPSENWQEVAGDYREGERAGHLLREKVIEASGITNAQFEALRQAGLLASS